jgi:hypothetical protein
MSDFRIGRTETEYISIRIVGRTNPVRENWEVNLVDVDVELAVGGFKGLFVTKLALGHLTSLRNELAQLHSSDLRELAFEPYLSPYNSNLIFKIKGDGLGNFNADFDVADEPGNQLEFRLSFDQTEIPEMLNGLDAMLTEYPFLNNAGS